MPRKPPPAPALPVPDVQVTVGHPITPAGLQLTVTIPLTQMEGMLATLLEWVEKNEAAWQRLPTTGPDTIHGGNPVSDADVIWDVGRKPKHVGF